MHIHAGRLDKRRMLVLAGYAGWPRGLMRLFGRGTTLGNAALVGEFI